MNLPLRIGLFGIGLDTYWPQFAGLHERLNRYVERVAERLARPDVEIVNLGLVDSADRARDAGHEFRRRDVDFIFLYVTTYALSSTVLPVVRRAGVPVRPPKGSGRRNPRRRGGGNRRPRAGG